jgi:hypothetical protein
MTTEVDNGAPPALATREMRGDNNRTVVDELREALHQQQQTSERHEKEQNDLKQKHQAAKAESSQLKNRLHQVVTAAKCDLEATEEERDTLRQENQLLLQKLKELQGDVKTLTQDKHVLLETSAEQQQIVDTLTRDVKQITLDQGTQEARSKFDQAELRNSKKHVALIESELEDLRAICNNFTESSSSQSLDYKTTMESLKKEKDQAWEEVDKVVSRNKNQANLLQRLEKRLTQVENNSAQQTKELQEQLQQERMKFMQLKKGSNGGIHMSMRNVFGSAPSSSGASLLDDGASVNSSSNSPKPFLSPGLTKADHISLRNLLKDNKQPPSQSSLSSSQSPDKSPDPPKRTSTEVRAADAEAWKEQKNQWRELMPVDGDSTSGQSGFLEAAVKKSEKKHTIWDQMFGYSKEEEIVFPLPLPTLTSSSSLLTREILETMKENERIFQEQETKRIEREEAKKEEELKVAKKSVKQLKTAVKWGLLNMFSSIDEEESEESDDGEQETDSHNKKGEPDDDEMSEMDMDTLRRLAFKRTAGLTEEELNRRLQQNDDDESTLTSERTESPQTDDYAALMETYKRRSSGLVSGMVSIQEKAPSHRLSTMSDITLPSEEFLKDKLDLPSEAGI